jgi:hypothetical protein
MGGNALKHVGVERKSRDDYFAISGLVCGALGRLFPQCHAQPILAYANKESFGDCDILLKSDNLPPNWHDLIRAEFQPQDMISNGGVLSFDYKGMQIDLITSPASEYDFAYTYFAFNDLGNLMGRIAHKMGFKYGHDGLWRMLRDERNQKYADVLVSLDVSAVFAFLGYDYAAWKQGFVWLEEVFEYAASTPYMSRVIFQLDNRNHVSRIRDMKRPSYNAFLKWIEDKPGLDKYKWSSYTGDTVTEERLKERAYWQFEAFNTFPGYQERCQEAYIKHERNRQAKQKWNGDIVRGITGLTGKLLGTFMERCRKQHDDFEAWVIEQTPEQIEAFVKEVQAAPQQ